MATTEHTQNERESHTLLLTGNILLKLRGVKAGGGGEESLLKAQNIISKRSL